MREHVVRNRYGSGQLYFCDRSAVTERTITVGFDKAGQIDHVRLACIACHRQGGKVLTVREHAARNRHISGQAHFLHAAKGKRTIPKRGRSGQIDDALLFKRIRIRGAAHQGFQAGAAREHLV